MKRYKESVVMDITHATQKPGKTKNQTGLLSSYSPYFGYAAALRTKRCFYGIVHPNPAKYLMLQIVSVFTKLG